MNNDYIEQVLLIFPFEKINDEFSEKNNLAFPYLSCWSGFLPNIKKVKHLLILKKLTGWIDPQFENYIEQTIDKFNIEATHEYSCLFQFQDQSSIVKLLFRFQIKANDLIAIKLLKTCAKAMINIDNSQQRYLINSQYSQLWSDLTQYKLKQFNSNFELWY